MMIADAAVRFRSHLELTAGEKRADAKSIMALITKFDGIYYGDMVCIHADGVDADEAVAAIVAVFEAGCGEPVRAPD